MRRLAVISGLIALAACDPATNTVAATNVAADSNMVEATTTDPATNTAASAAAPVVNLAPNGLSIVADGAAPRLIAFDTPRADVIAALGALGNESRNEECGAGPMEMGDLPSGLQLTFMEGKFVGWTAPDGARATGAALTTDKGIGIGSTRQALEAAYSSVNVEDSSLGVEFQANDLYGLLDSKAPTGKITSLWAGATCIFR